MTQNSAEHHTEHLATQEKPFRFLDSCIRLYYALAALDDINLSDLKQHLKQMLLEWREKQYAADKKLVAGDDTIRHCLASPNYNNPES